MEDLTTQIENMKKNLNNLLKDNEVLKNENNYQLFKVKTQRLNLENQIQKLNNEINYLKIENKQYEVIQYYIKNKKNNLNDYSPKLSFLERIYNNLKIKITHQKFEEISLYYIKNIFLKYLIAPQNIDIFLNPVITPEGDTLNYNKNIGKNYIKNNLVFQICEILKQKDKLEMNDFIQLKLLLKDKKTGKYFKNPIVISTGETIEGDYNIHKCYQNKVIFNLINDIGILLEESFFNFKEINYDYIENNKEKYDNNELTIYTLNLEINNLTQKNKDYEKQILDFKNQEEKYKQDINNLKEKNSKLTLEINKLEEENKKLISEINKLKEENNKLNQNVQNNNVNNNEREVIVSFDNKNFLINFDKNISFQNFKNIFFKD